MLQTKTKILYNKRVKNNYFLLAFRAPKISREALPGQFLTLKVNAADEPLLRRPFSIHRLKGANVEILYEVVGRATEILSRRKPGGYLDVVGPLGGGFTYAPHAARRKSHILVAGGMGVAPLLFLAERLVHSAQRTAQSRLLVLLGAKTDKQIFCEKAFRDLGCAVKIATDDGSRGFKGKVTDLLKHLLSAANSQLSAIYTCGPRPMLKAISEISKKHRIPAQVSLEEHMACGIGACLGCAVNTKKGFQRACKEGPVFGADEIIW